MEAEKDITSEDMAITLLIQLAELIDYASFYSSLLTNGWMDTITWEELVPLVLDQKERLVKEARGAEALATKQNGTNGTNQNNKRGATSQPHPTVDKACNHCNEPSHFGRPCPLHSKPQASLRPKDDSKDSSATATLAKTQPFQGFQNCTFALGFLFATEASSILSGPTPSSGC